MILIAILTGRQGSSACLLPGTYKDRGLEEYDNS